VVFPAPLQPRFGEAASAKKSLGNEHQSATRNCTFSTTPQDPSNPSKMADKVEKAKKRKRHTDGSSKPSKRVAIEGDNQVKISIHEVDKWAPIIGMLTVQYPISCL